MTEEKIFWKVGKDETLNASEVKIMYVDGNALLWGYIEDGNVSEWYKCDDTDAEFFLTEAEARRQQSLSKSITIAATLQKVSKAKRKKTSKA